MPTWTKEQVDAIEKSGSNIIVSAGAGSGKTAVLSERVIYKLNHGIHVDELLILTFTRAAAEEMKNRIRKKIKANPDFQRELDALESAYITTFDSFALSIVKKYHYLLNIPASIAITDDSIVSLEKKKIIDRVFARNYVDLNVDFAELVKRFSLKNDKQLKSAVLTLAETIENYTDREGYLTFIKTKFYEKENIDSIVGEFLKLLESRKQTLKMELENTYYYFDEKYNEKLSGVILPVINAKDFEELDALKGIKLPAVPRGTDEEAKAAKENLKGALDELFKLLEYGSPDAIAEDIMSTKSTCLALVSLIEAYFEELSEYKKENSIYTFSDVAELATRVLKENEEARLELKNKFKEIMIDEYQDTNDVQENFIALFSNDNVYMVGDIKQSIYRFRGSNPSIFKDKYDNYSVDNGGKKIDLIKNFRSREEVLANINLVFAYIMTDNLGGAAYTVSHEMIYGNRAYDDAKVEDYDYDFEILEYDPKTLEEFSKYEIEIFAIANDIKKKIASGFKVFDKDSGEMRTFRYSDAVIILDRSKYFDTFKKIFEYLSIPLTIQKKDKLNASMDMYLLKNMVDMAIRIHAGDFGVEFKYAFMSIGRSFLYECSDAELFETFANNTFKTSKVYTDFANIESFDSLSVREILEHILSITHLYDKISKIGDYDNTNIRMTKLLEMASNLGSIGYTIKDFRDYLGEVIEAGLKIEYTPPTVDADSVKIMTIHTSKGLEYPVCYFADLDHLFNTRDLKEKFIASPKYGLIAPIRGVDEDDSESVTKLLYKQEFLKEEIGEKIRLFYVALTRAREKMIILLPKKDTKKLEKDDDGSIAINRRIKFMSLAEFIYGVKDYIPKYFHTLDINDIGLTKNYLYTKEASLKLGGADITEFEVTELDFTSVEVEEKRFSKSTPELISKESEDNMRFGTKIHEILEYLDFKNFDPSSIENPFIRSKITKFMGSDILKNVSDAKVYKEYEFIYTKDNTEYHGIVDAMLEYDDHIDIIDYKLKNVADEHYVEQLNGYKEYVESVSKKKTHIYLYSILDETLTKLD